MLPYTVSAHLHFKSLYNYSWRTFFWSSALLNLLILTVNLDFEAAFGFCRNGEDADVFIRCFDAASTSLSSCRIAALSLFANVIAGFNSKVHKFLSLLSLQKLKDVLDAAHYARDTCVIEGSLAVFWNIAASEGNSEHLIAQVMLPLVEINSDSHRYIRFVRV
jgi:hypothetical protein